MSEYEDALGESTPDPNPEPKERKGKRRPKVHAPPADLEPKGGRCQAYSPRGTRCKFCGKEHG